MFKFNNPIAQRLYNENKINELLIVNSFGFPVLAKIDIDETSGYLELHNDHYNKEELISKNNDDINTYLSIIFKQKNNKII